MFQLKKLNVHRIVETEQQKAKLIAEGFEEVIVKVVEVVKEDKATKETVKKGKA